MLPKKNRAGTKQIEQIFKKGSFLSSNNLTFRFMFDPGRKTSQISFIAPKTVIKSAVGRNLLRRRGYMALKPHLSSFPPGIIGAFVFSKKSNYLFGGKKTVESNPILNIEHEIKTILNKLH